MPSVVKRSTRRARRAALAEPMASRTLLSAGDLDPTFGDGGKVTTAFPGSAYDHVRDMVVQAAGKYVVAGFAASDAGFSEDAGFALARYHPDGSLDASFGDGGRVLVPFGRYGAANAVALAPGGKIVAAGMTSDADGTLGREHDFA